MKETSEQTINRVIDRLKDILDKGNAAEKRQLADLLGQDEVNVFCALCEVEDDMQERFDLNWSEAAEEEEAKPEPETLKFPNLGTRKKKTASR